MSNYKLRLKEDQNLNITPMIRDPIQNVVELYSFEGEEFVVLAYRHLLGREPDAHGLAYYLGRLAQGVGKEAIVAQMAQSEEAKPAEQIMGLSALLLQQRRAQSWFWGWLTAGGRRERLQRQQIAKMDHLLVAKRDAMARASQEISSLQDTIKSISLSLEKLSNNVGALTPSLNALHRIVAENPVDQTAHAPHYPLSEDDVRQSFLEILGRAPENDQTIEHHRNFPSYADLVSYLMKSQEYQSSVSGYTRFLLNRLAKVRSASLQGA
jgi:hypothetical protein